MAYTKGHGGLIECACTEYAATDSALTVWSIPQFEQLQTVYSQNLGQLQHHLTATSNGQAFPSGTSLLTSSIINMTRAMTGFLQRRYDMMQRLDGLGRVVETESSQTWYAQPENVWLRKAVADLKAKCDAFSWVVNEICQASANSKRARSSIKAPTAVTRQTPSEPGLRSYNSFSSIGSEVPRGRSRRAYRTPDTSNPSTPITNPFSDSSSVYSGPAYSTSPSSLEPDSPVEANSPLRELACSHFGDERFHRDSDDSIGPDPTVSAALRGLLQLDLGKA